MLTAQNATEERVAEYVAALQHEKAGYQARLQRIKAGRQDPLSEAAVAARVKDVDAELARVKKLGVDAGSEEAAAE